MDVLRLRWLSTAQREHEAAAAVGDEIAEHAWSELARTLSSLLSR